MPSTPIQPSTKNDLHADMSIAHAENREEWEVELEQVRDKKWESFGVSFNDADYLSFIKDLIQRTREGERDSIRKQLENHHTGIMLTKEGQECMRDVFPVSLSDTITKE